MKRKNNNIEKVILGLALLGTVIIVAAIVTRPAAAAAPTTPTEPTPAPVAPTPSQLPQEACLW